MKGIVFHQHGGPEVLKYTDAPDPTIRPNEVLVRVRACALNHLDLWVRIGNPNVPIPLPHIPGSDISGEIAQIGADVSTVRVRSEEHTSELQSPCNLVCRLLLEKKTAKKLGATPL